jgi:glycerate dehydrogenase
MEALGNCVMYDNTAPNDVVSRSNGADALIIGGANRVTPSVVDALPASVGYIGTASTEFDHINIAATSKRGIVVTNAPGYATTSVAQTVMSFILSLSRNLHTENTACPIGDCGTWPKRLAPRNPSMNWLVV